MERLTLPESNVEKGEFPDLSTEGMVAQLEDPIEKIIYSLEDEIYAGNLGLIIGEDSSGRIPTLMIRDIVSELACQSGVEPPVTRFIAGSKRFVDRLERYKLGLDYVSEMKLEADRRLEKQEKITEYIESQKESLRGRKILVVTEALETGESLATLTDVLDQLSIDYEVAVIGVDSRISDEELADFQKKFHGKLHIGQRVIPQIAQEAKPAGVIKSPGDLHSQRLTTSVLGKIMGRKRVSNEMTTARMRAKEQAQRIIDKIRSNENKTQ